MGQGVAVAVVDSGAEVGLAGLSKDHTGRKRILALYDAIADKTIRWNDKSIPKDVDEYGHGTHVAGTAVGSEVTVYGQYAGVAPGADLVVVKALGSNGGGSYTDVIRAIDWVTANKDRYGIRVMNLSLSATPHSYYWDDPLNQAVMRPGRQASW